MYIYLEVEVFISCKFTRQLNVNPFYCSSDFEIHAGTNKRTVGGVQAKVSEIITVSRLLLWSIHLSYCITG